MGVSGLHAGKALVRLGRTTPPEAEDGGGGRRTGRGHRHWETMVEEECGEEALRFGGFPSPARGSAARLDWDPCTKPFGAPGEVRSGELTGGGRGACVWQGRALSTFLHLQPLCEKRKESRGNIRRFTP